MSSVLFNEFQTRECKFTRGVHVQEILLATSSFSTSIFLLYLLTYLSDQVFRMPGLKNNSLIRLPPALWEGETEQSRRETHRNPHLAQIALSSAILISALLASTTSGISQIDPHWSAQHDVKPKHICSDIIEFSQSAKVSLPEDQNH